MRTKLLRALAAEDRRREREEKREERRRRRQLRRSAAAPAREIAPEPFSGALDFLWAEITGRCQLRCSHCYSESGPWGTHGTMTPHDWIRVVDEAAGMGCRSMQFIGGEPTMHPALPALVRHALGRGMAVEVYSNLLRVTPVLWETFELAGVSLATSYYSSSPEEHHAITGRRGHRSTLANVTEARRRGIPLRVGMVTVSDGQQVDAATAQLRELGITDIHVDHVRRLGRGRDVGDSARAVDELCGHCADAQLAVTSDGTVYPCTMSRWLPLGNVRSTPLTVIHADATAVRVELETAFAGFGLAGECDPAERKRRDDGNCNLCDPSVKKLVRCDPQRRERCGPDAKKGRT